VAFAQLMWSSASSTITPSGIAWAALRKRASCAVRRCWCWVVARIRRWSWEKTCSQTPEPIGTGVFDGLRSQATSARRLTTWRSSTSASPTARVPSAHTGPAAGHTISAATANTPSASAVRIQTRFTARLGQALRRWDRRRRREH